MTVPYEKVLSPQRWIESQRDATGRFDRKGVDGVVWSNKATSIFRTGPDRQHRAEAES